MRKTARPQVDVSDVFKACCGTVRDSARKHRILANATTVASASSAYAAAGQAGDLEFFAADGFQIKGPATSDDFEWLYSNRLITSKDGRRYYSELRDGNSERCALCNVHRATTLDHHLPKATFPLLAVSPDNLLPCCKDCNHAKSDSSTAILNSYFDDLGTGRWLRARIVKAGTLIPDYYVSPQPGWSSGLTRRAMAHFELLGLKKLYGANAARYLTGISSMLDRLEADIGADGVRKHLEYQAESFRSAEPNGWESAILFAAADSDWYCSGGFRKVKLGS